MAKNMHNPATGTASTFSFNPKHTLRTRIDAGHWHTTKGYGTVREKGSNDWLIIYTARGHGRFTSGDRKIISSAGDFALWPPGVPHDYRFESGDPGWEILWAHFFPWPHWLDMITWPKPFDTFLYLSISDHKIRKELKSILKEMVQYARSPFLSEQYLSLNALERVFLLCSSCAPDEGGPRLDSRIKKALHFLSTGYDSSINIGMLARHCGISASRLSHLFKDQAGMTPMQFLEQQRLSHATMLLERSGFSIKQIAGMTGFESQFYFTRRFTKHAGLSPRAYRNRLPEIPGNR